MAKPIRLAMLRVDNHLYHFLPVIAKLNMRQFREVTPECHYWFTDCYRPFEVVPRFVKGFKVTRLWDTSRKRMEQAASVFDQPPELVEDPKNLARDVDAAFIADCSGDGDDHLKLAEPFLRKRIPTFVDKPFALKTRDAVQMAELARRYKTPLYSTSLLSVTHESDLLRRQFSEIGKVTGGNVCGAPGWATESGQEGVIHGVSLMHAVFGYGVQWARSIGDYAAHYTVFGYDSGMQVSMNLTRGMNGYTAEVFGSHRDPNKRHVHTGLIGNTAFAVGASTVCARFRRMIKTGTPPRDYEEMIQDIAVCEAARRSWKLGRKISVQSVWKQGGAAVKLRRTG